MAADDVYKNKTLMNKSLLAVSVVLSMVVLMITGCGSGRKQKLEGQVSVSGAFALYPLAVQWSNDFQVRYPEVKIDVSAGGAGKGMTDVLNGMVDYAMLSRELHKEEVDAGAVAFVVGRDAVIPVINSENPHIQELLCNTFQPLLETPRSRVQLGVYK